MDSNLANTLNLNDGTTVELPTNVLLDSINQGQVTLLTNNNRKIDSNNNRRIDYDSSDGDQDFGSSFKDPVIRQ